MVENDAVTIRTLSGIAKGIGKITRDAGLFVVTVDNYAPGFMHDLREHEIPAGYHGLDGDRRIYAIALSPGLSLGQVQLPSEYVHSAYFIGQERGRQK